MAKYIEREAFLEDAEERYCLPCKGAGKDHNGLKCRACWVDDMCGDIIGAPAADAALVRHGHWIYHPDDLFPNDSTQECSYCHAEESLTLYNENYCPNCGARMDEEASE